MKLNGIEVNLQQMDVELVDGIFIIYNCTSKKIILFNETSSFIWKIILEHERTGGDVDTTLIVHKILDLYDISGDREEEICRDVEEILQIFFDSWLLCIKPSKGNESYDE